MMQWRFYIDDTEYPQPESFTDLVLGLKRDVDYHGVFFEASVGNMTFSGDAAAYILAKEKELGLKAVITFRAENRCDENGQYVELIRGKLNMGKLDESCGTSCAISVPIEQENCTMLLRNRFDQKVDMDSLLAFDKLTTLQAYPYSGFLMDMPARRLFVSVEGSVADDGDVVDLEIFSGAGIFFVRPTYARPIFESIQESQLLPNVFAAMAGGGGFNDTIISPVLLLDDVINCFNGLFAYSVRVKGSYDITWQTFAGASDSIFNLVVAYGEFTGLVDDTLNPDLTILHSQAIPFPVSGGAFDHNTGTFDYSFAGSFDLPNEKGFYIYLENGVVSGANLNVTGTVTFDKETHVSIAAEKQCPASESTVYAVNETLSRVTEAITNGCLKVKSDYYGRTDSLPYASDADGCGSLRVLNSGLQLRNATEAKFFTSLKDIFEGLKPIDNIGFSIEPDLLRTGFDVLRVEDVSYFYKNEEILALRAAPSVKITVLESEHYSTIKVGYEKWEVESVNGLDEFNSNREYRTSLNSISTLLTILSKFVAGSYPIEITRQQSFAVSGGADTKYDNDTFIYCVIRQLYGFDIEQGNITTPTNIFSPDTVYNWRIRPFSNLMRWFRSIAASYVNVNDTDNRLFFTAGTGNYLASGEMTSVFCKPENGVKAENGDVSKSDFVNTVDYLPIWRPKIISLKYPLSVGEYKKIKASPYGYISVQCGTGDWLKGYIQTIQYSPTKGEADFTLKLKYNAS